MTCIQYTAINYKNHYGPENTYHSRQKNFINRSEKTIRDGCRTIEESVKLGKDVSGLFYQLIDTFAKERQKIAYDEGTPDATTFGQRPEDSMGNLNRYTPLAGPYENTNRTTLEKIKNELISLRRTKKEFIETSKKVSEFALNHHFSYHYEIISSEEIKKRKWDHPLTSEQFRAITRKIGQPSLGENFSQKEFSKILFNYSAAMKQSDPLLHESDRMNFYLKILNQIYPSKQNPQFLKSEYVLITSYTEINQKMVPTNQLLTWVYRNFSEDPFERMVDNSVLFVLHQDPHLIQESLEECARLFAEIIKERDTLTENELIEKVALVRYIFAHAMPFQRGSAAVGEWLEGSIYQYLGFWIRPKNPTSNDSVDKAAITSLQFSEYLQKYKEMTQITRMDRGNEMHLFWSLD